MSEKPTVTDIFNRALEIHRSSPDAAYKEIAEQIISEYKGKPFPASAYLTIPEQDHIAPEEDWTAGLPVVLRGIQNEDWNDIALGVIISLEQVENYPKQSGREDDPAKNWRHRKTRIADAEEKVLEKWMPEDLMELARRSVAK